MKERYVKLIGSKWLGAFFCRSVGLKTLEPKLCGAAELPPETQDFTYLAWKLLQESTIVVSFNIAPQFLKKVGGTIFLVRAGETSHIIDLTFQRSRPAVGGLRSVAMRPFV